MGLSKKLQKIQQAAIRLFARRGYHHTSLDDICASAGVSKSLLYYHYNAKAELFTDLVAPVLDGTDTILARWAGRAVPLDPHDREALLAQYLELLAAHVDAIRCLINDRPARADTGVNDRWSAQQAALRGLISGDQDDVVAAAALGALLRPIAVLGEQLADPDAQTNVVMAADAAALSTQQ